MPTIRKRRQLARVRRKQRIRGKIFGTPDKPRLTVYRTDKHIYAQLVDDSSGRTMTGVSSLSPGLKDAVAKARKKDKVELSRLVGEEIAKKANKLKVEGVVFDRNGFMYHGRIKAVAEAARKAGLKF